jgi:hypothetical protein
MEKVRDVSGSGPVSVDGAVVGHCAFEINVYKDAKGHVIGQGYAHGDPVTLGKMYYGQRVQLSEMEDKPFLVVTGDWSPGQRNIPLEVGPGILS